MESARDEEVLMTDGLELRPADGLVLAEGRALTFSVREFQLLVALVRRADGIVSRPQLYEQVWGRPLRTGDRSIDVYIHKVRAKLERAAPGRAFIHTHVGFGYRFSPEPSHPLHITKTDR